MAGIQYVSHQLTPAQVQTFHDQGYLVVRKILSDDQCDTAIERAEREGGSSGAQTLMQPHREDDYFLELLQSRHITEPIETIIGPPIAGLATQFYFCPHGSSGLMKHQDNFCVEASDGQFASCWIPLVDVDTENGCLMVYPGTQKTGLLDVRPLGISKIRATHPNMLEESIVPEGSAEPIALPLRRGTGVFLDGALVHESLPNAMPENRYAFLATYLRKGAPFRPGNTAKREEVDLGLS